MKHEIVLTFTEIHTKTLFLNEILEMVKNQFQKGIKIQAVDKFNMNFRLHLVGNYINFELLLPSEFGLYGKPIGFYDKQMNIYILREFEGHVNQLLANNEIPNSLSILTLSLEENALIAALSMDVLIEASKVLKDVEKGNIYELDFEGDFAVPGTLKYDREIIANGLNCELIMTFAGYPQFNLDDSYDLNTAICAYMTSGNGLSIHPLPEFQDLFDNFAQRKLLSAFNRI